MQLIVLAAGLGARLKPLTKKKPKCLIKYRGNSLIKLLINNFKKHNLKRIIVVTGYKSKLIKKELGKNILYIKNNNYRTTNNIYSLWKANKFLNMDTIISFADLIVSKKIIKNLVKDKSNISVVVDKSTILPGTMTVKTKKKNLLSIGKKNEIKPTGNFIGIAKIRKNKITKFKKILKINYLSQKNNYYTEVFNHLVRNGEIINTVNTNNNFWMEIDDQGDLNKLRNYKKQIK